MDRDLVERQSAAVRDDVELDRAATVPFWLVML
jgi:hypothetical protein